MPEYTKKIVYLSDAQYQELIMNKSITVNGVTVNYDKNMIYMTPQNTPLYAEDLAEWAKASTKPNYTAVEVGALPSNTHIPTTTAELTNDAGFITSAAVPTKISDLTDDSGHYTKPATGIPASDLSEEIVSTIDGKAPAIYCEKSGAIASFDDGAGNMPLKECVVNIEPVQDLHGQDAPYPPGGGKNKINYLSCVGVGARDGTESIYGNNTSISGMELTINQAYGNNGGILKGVGTFPLATGEYVTISGKATLVGSLRLVVGIANYNGGGTNNINTQVPVTDGKFSVTLNAKSDYSKTGIFLQPATSDSTVVVSEIMVALGQTEQPYAPYSNICPISGFDSVKVSRAGKNLAAVNMFSTSHDTVMTFSPSIPAGTYSYSYIATRTGSSTDNGAIRFVYDDGTYTQEYLFISTERKTKAITFQKSVASIYVYSISGSYAESGNYTLTCTDFQLELGSTATAYEPYQGETYSITFPTEAGTVYGGTVDVVRGTLTVDFKKVTLSSANQSWTYYGNAVWTDNLSDRLIGNDNQLDAICTHLKNAKINVISGTAAKNYPGCFIMFGSNTNALARMYICVDPTFDSRAQYVEWLDENTPELVYKLATPITYTLTPQEIRTLLGTNNIWADTGNTTVTYPVDTKMFVEQNTPDVPVQDVQVNGTSVLTDGVANVPVAGRGTLGAVQVSGNQGLLLSTSTQGLLMVKAASSASIKTGQEMYTPIVPGHQSESVFYGLAKAAGADMKNIANTTVGTYPDTQKEAIQSMLGITQMLAPTNPNLVASQAYSIGDVFAANGHLYKATVAIAQDEAIIPDTNCVETTMADAGGKIKDVQVAGSSVVGSDGVASMPYASNNVPGLFYSNTASGFSFDRVDGIPRIQIKGATPNQMQAGSESRRAIVPAYQHYAIFYGLSKVAGVDLASETVTLGTYPETSKTAIKAMLGVQDGLKVVRLI